MGEIPTRTEREQMVHLIKGAVNIRKCTGHYHKINPDRVIRSPSRMIYYVIFAG